MAGLATGALPQTVHQAAASNAPNNFLVPNATIVVELLIFLVVFAVFYKWIVPPLQQVLDEREAMVRRTIEDNDEAARLVRAAEERYGAVLAQARVAASVARDTARTEANQVREELREVAHREVERARRHGEERLRIQRDELLRHSDVDALALQLAERILGQALGCRGASSGAVSTAVSSTVSSPIDTS